MLLSKAFPIAVLACVTCGGLTTALGQSIKGPSSSQPPYLIRTKNGVTTKSILTVGDSVNFKADGVTPYRMVGIPDGLGAFDNGDGTFTVLINHEIASGGIVRDHGVAGAFVSRWIIEKATLRVLHGEDLMKTVSTWNTNLCAYAPMSAPAFRFCSADLPPLSAFYNAASGLGYPGLIYMNGEETGNEGRNFGHLLDGTSYDLPRLGKFSHENSVTHPNTGNKTVVVGLDDTSPLGQVYVYVGDKTLSSNPIDAAGLNNGSLFGIKVVGFPQEVFATGIPSGTPFTTYNFGDVSCQTGGKLNADSFTNEVTGFWRPEDGCWDPVHPNDFYFVTTASFTGLSRLWRLRFFDAANPAIGGTIDMLLNGTEGHKMLDNITVTTRGEIIALEDVGENDHIGKVWRYIIATGQFEMVAQHDPDLFAPGAPHFLTNDEESSGVIPVFDILGTGWFLVDVQAHYRTDSELVEGGQLLAIRLPDPNGTK
ncbi:MAG TPA: hypothetical protein VNH84_05295 [Candidatus Saccharimonadales bacterium]|nr:hypothetical protein [Candidatus Saccharimonadales bacterium]